MTVTNNSTVFYRGEPYKYIGLFFTDTFIALSFADRRPCSETISDLEKIGWASLTDIRLGVWDEDPFDMPRMRS